MRRKEQSDKLRPPPELTLSEFSDIHRFLSPESSALPGRYKSSFASYQKEMQDVIFQRDVDEVYYMVSAQSGKSTILENLILYITCYVPAPILLVQPTVAMASTCSKLRIDPLFRDSPISRGIIAPVKSRDSGNTILEKRFAGGNLSIIGSNSETQLASRSIKFLLIDEIDRFEDSASEGSVFELLKQRTSNYYDSKVIVSSTPTLKGDSNIEALYNSSDQRHYYHKCQHCQELFLPVWDLVSNAELHCSHCGGSHNDVQRIRSMREGVWIASNPDIKHKAGFHLNVLSSPWV
ncbi:phage terminase large subunit family protein, partial [bacterium]|nr:phage terminase large subunit family protein [bacterium]